MSQRQLQDVLDDVRALLARNDNDYAWSHWSTKDEALAEFDTLTGRSLTGDAGALQQLITLFAPTASLQETAMSSGWGDRFLKLAGEFDATIQQP